MPQDNSRLGVQDLNAIQSVRPVGRLKGPQCILDLSVQNLNTIHTVSLVGRFKVLQNNFNIGAQNLNAIQGACVFVFGQSIDRQTNSKAEH